MKGIYLQEEVVEYEQEQRLKERRIKQERRLASQKKKLTRSYCEKAHNLLELSTSTDYAQRQHLYKDGMYYTKMINNCNRAAIYSLQYST